MQNTCILAQKYMHTNTSVLYKALFSFPVTTSSLVNESNSTKFLQHIYIPFENHLFYFSFIYLFFFYFIFKLYNIVLVLPYIKMNPPQVYTCSPSWTLLPPPSPYHPSGSSQCTSPKHLVSCIESGLVTRFIYDIIHISMPFSQIISPFPSPTESKRLFYNGGFVVEPEVW